MNPRQKKTLILALCFSIILFSGATFSLGKADYTLECGGGTCHTDYSLFISSNATGTVDADLGTPFTLVIDAWGYSGSKAGNMATAVKTGWMDNDQFSFTSQSISDNDPADTDANIGQMTTTWIFTPQSVGNWNIRIHVAAKGGLSQNLTVPVAVTSSDTTPPTIDSPDDQSIAEGNGTASVTWTPNDANPSSYEILDNGAAFQSGTWDGSPITAMLGSLTLGAHTLTITVFDAANNNASDQVGVTVYDGTTPLIDSPANVTYDEGASGSTIIWDPTDFHPSSYVIYREGTLIKSGTWNSSAETISILVEGESLGEYNYTIEVTDVGSNSVADTVWVIVSDGTPPTIDSPSDINYNEGEAGSSITWDPSDIHPLNYTIYKDGVPIKSGAWNSSLETITITVEGLSLGIYDYTLEVFDIGGNPASDVVRVTVGDGTPPNIDSPLNVTYAEGTPLQSITWDPTDSYPLSYFIYRNSVQVKSGTWNDTSETISISVVGLDLGLYNYTILVTDIGLNTANDTVWVEVYDGTAPTIDQPSDFQMSEDTPGNNVTWSPFDLHPSHYEIFLEEVLFKSGLWNSSSEPITVSVDGLSLGVYNLTIVVYDSAGFTAADMLDVTVVDGTPPSIDEPGDEFYPEGETGHNITWTPSDLHPVSYVVYKNETPIMSGTWNATGETIVVYLDGLVIGLHNFTLVVTDIGGNSASDLVWVTIFSADVPTIDDLKDTDVIEESTGNYLVWNPLDLNPQSYAVYRNGTLYKSGSWNSSAELIQVLIDGLDLGRHNFTVIVTDQDANTATDMLWVTVYDGTPPNVDNPGDIYYDEGDPGSSITWDPTDTNPVNYEVYKDEVLLQSGTWNSTLETLTISVENLPRGSYNFTLVVYDIGGNRGNDTVMVYVSDGTPPTIDTPPDINYNEGDAGGLIVWSPTDSYPSSYEIYLNEVLIKSGLWNSSLETITISVTGQPRGTHNFTLAVYDIDGNSKSDSVDVVVSDATLPVIDAPSDVLMDEGSPGLTISWHPTDLNPASYTIYLDELVLRSGNWNSSSETIVQSLDGLALSDHNYTIIVFDVDANWANDTVYVTVVDGTSPTIDSPSNVSYTEGETGNTIVWNPSDLHPIGYTIYLDEIEIKTGLWNDTAESIFISADGLTVGDHNVTIVVWDVGSNVASDEVTVTVMAVTTTTAPETTSTTTTTTSTPTTTTTTSTPAPPPPLPVIPMLTIILSWGAAALIVLLISEVLVRRRR
ncbi:MAG: hypothetical protein ACXACD_04845 [Candidatus Thorarchaeota archaeon]|jgi:hypothetical protein